MSLNIKSNYENDSNEWLVALKGELDLACANNLKEELYKAVEEKFADVVIDMTDLEYIDSTGIGVLVGLMKKLRTDGKDIKISNAKDNVKRIFKITGLDQIINMEDKFGVRFNKHEYVCQPRFYICNQTNIIRSGQQDWLFT